MQGHVGELVELDVAFQVVERLRERLERRDACGNFSEGDAHGSGAMYAPTLTKCALGGIRVATLLEMEIKGSGLDKCGSMVMGITPVM